uniref:NADH-ubiquinone oxidoreductase chain 3 n=1 Tax=Aureoumbra lagunensis TaxID=44058 RepID=A0A7U0QG87_9STRA|nr:NADH dehydrogenase subunit 3 [Aureoumbra lagunensis]QQW50410.1 NADH dehydrogenase subunit 3 [Aureoumbra lagunensis]
MLFLFYQEYFSIMLLVMFAVILALIIFFASIIFSVNIPDTEKLSAYECGFDPYEDARNAFDVRFYIVAILFIVFDLEAMFLYPWVSVLCQLNYFGFWVMIDFLIELIIGFIYAWKIGALEWE